MTPEQEEQIKKLRLGCYLNAAMVKKQLFFIYFLFIVFGTKIVLFEIEIMEENS